MLHFEKRFVVVILNHIKVVSDFWMDEAHSFTAEFPDLNLKISWTFSTISISRECWLAEIKVLIDFCLE